VNEELLKWLGTGIAGTILGAGLKSLFDEWMARNRARRDMATTITKNIEDLAKNYYWLLANHASTLASSFQAYRRDKEKLQARQKPPEEIQADLDALAARTAEESFYYYARLMKTVFEFNWQASSTYFLRHYWAGPTLASLCNALIAAMQAAKVSGSTIIDYLETPGPDGKPRLISPAAFDQLLKDQSDKSGKTAALCEAFENYRERFIGNDELVSRAAAYLQAYSDLFHYELSLLYKDWFADWKGYIQRDLEKVKFPRELLPSTQSVIRDTAHTRAGLYAIAPIGAPLTSNKQPVRAGDKAIGPSLSPATAPAAGAGIAESAIASGGDTRAD
jgi:hypothetical protein